MSQRARRPPRQGVLACYERLRDRLLTQSRRRGRGQQMVNMAAVGGLWLLGRGRLKGRDNGQESFKLGLETIQALSKGLTVSLLFGKLNTKVGVLGLERGQLVLLIRENKDGLLLLLLLLWLLLRRRGSSKECLGLWLGLW